MKLLAVDSTAAPASVAIWEDGKLYGEFFTHTSLTHSVTLMPMCQALLQNTMTDIKEIDAFAVAAGPGSFTGVRIGVAAVKGMAQALDKPCIAVSTLEAMAQNLLGTDCIVCSVMDARCKQFYNALFQSKGGTLTRLTQDRALSYTQLAADLKAYKERIVLTGDGSEAAYALLSEEIKNLELAQPLLRYQRAGGVAMAAQQVCKQGGLLTAAQLMPFYLRLPQAERELKKKTEGAKNASIGSGSWWLSDQRGRQALSGRKRDCL